MPKNRFLPGNRLGAVLVVVGLTALAFPTSAQNVADSFTPFLNASNLEDMAFDGQDNLWIASNGGALRFHVPTRTWTTFPRLLGTGPRGNDLATVSIDAAGNVWCGSATRGFTFYNPNLDFWDRDSEEWPDPRIRVIRTLGTGVYIGTQNGLSLKPTPTRTDICSDADPGCIVPSFVVNDYALMGDTLWVATKTGLGRFNGATWDSSSALPPGSIGQESLSLAVYQGVLWEAYQDSRNVIDPPDSVRRFLGGVWESYDLDAHRLVVSNGLLHAVEDNAVFRFDGTSWIDLNVPLSSSLNIADIEIVSGDMYLATDDGLALWEGGSSISWQDIPPGPQLRGVFSGVSVDLDGDVWAGTSERRIGLVEYDDVSWSLTNPGTAGLSSQWILDLFTDTANDLWVGHCCCPVPASCAIQVSEDGQFTEITDVLNARSVAQDAGGRVWAATRGFGVHVLDDASGAWSSLYNLTPQNTAGDLHSERTSAIVPTATHAFIGLEADGLDIWAHGGDLNNGRAGGPNWSHIEQGGFGLLDDNVTAMTVFGSDVWVGTAGGIHRFIGASIVERCPTRDRSVPGDQTRKVNALVTDRFGGLWIGTDAGLMYLGPELENDCDGGGGDFSIFTDQNSPIPDNRVVAAGRNPSDGTLWFGTADGLLQVDPLLFARAAPDPSDFVLFPNPLAIPARGVNEVFFGIRVGTFQAKKAPRDLVSDPAVFDITGQHIADFALDAEGAWYWDGFNLNGDRVASGIYLVRAYTSEGETVVRKLGVIRQ